MEKKKLNWSVREVLNIPLALNNPSSYSDGLADLVQSPRMVGDENVIWGAVISSSKVSIIYISEFIINPF